MSNKKRLTALLLIAALLCAFALVGCSGQDDANAEDDAVNDLGDAATTDDSADDSLDTTDDADSEVVLGVVSAVGTNYLMLTTYTAPNSVTDYTALDIASLTETENTVFVYPTEDTVYYLSADGGLIEAAATDVTEGDLIAETVSDSGEHQIIILTNAADTVE